MARPSDLFFLDNPVGVIYVSSYSGASFLSFLKKYASETSNKRIGPFAIAAGIACARLTKLGKHVAAFLQRRKFFFRYLRLLCKGGTLLILGILSLPIVLVYVFLAKLLKIFNPSKIQQFTDDLKKLCATIQIEPGDLVFIPTLGLTELMGVAHYTEHHKSEGLTWHFLFRRNLYMGREPSYREQFDSILPTLQAFSAYQRSHSAAATFFYTDTDPLTSQYNSMGLFPFRTLPIPLDNTLDKTVTTTDHRPLHITYIGDARDEKGFPLLAQLVTSVRAAGYGTEDIRFVLQSNFNVPDGEPGSRLSRAELASQHSDLVHLADGPFESEDYNQLVNNADIILIPYDSDCYYARSSGIFAESLAAGTPLIASNQSWMSQEFLSYDQQYFRQLLEKSEILATYHLAGTARHSQLLIKPRMKGKACWLLIEIRQNVPLVGQYMHVRWKTSPMTILKADPDTNYFRQTTIDLRKERVFGLMRVPYGQKILLSFVLDNGQGDIAPVAKNSLVAPDISVHELGTEPPRLFSTMPLYSDAADLTAAVIELIEHYSTYLQQAKAIRHAWRDYHSSSRLVLCLTKSTL